MNSSEYFRLVVFILDTCKVITPVGFKPDNWYSYLNNFLIQYSYIYPSEVLLKQQYLTVNLQHMEVNQETIIYTLMGKRQQHNSSN